MSTSWVQVFFNTAGMIAVINSVLWSLFLVPFSEERQALRPYHNHDEIQKLSSGEIVLVDVEICPTSMVFEADHRLILEIEAHDSSDAFQFQHNDPDDRTNVKSNYIDHLKSSTHFVHCRKWSEQFLSYARPL